METTLKVALCKDKKDRKNKEKLPYRGATNFKRERKKDTHTHSSVQVVCVALPYLFCSVSSVTT